MGVYLNPGNDRFKRTCNSEIYVDKTELIKLTNKAMLFCFVNLQAIGRKRKPMRR